MTPTAAAERERRRHPAHDALYELEPEIRDMLRFSALMVMALAGKGRGRVDGADEDEALQSLSFLTLATAKKVKALWEMGMEESKGMEIPELPRRPEFMQELRRG